MADHERDENREAGGMAMRGVMRPMAQRMIRKQHDQMHSKDEGDDHDKHGGHEMTREQRMEMLHMHHKQTLWCYWTIIALGFWMLFSPTMLGYSIDPASPSGGREVWLSLNARILAMTWSDIISGALLIVFGWRSLMPNRPISLWICCFTGIWLNFAPLVFWCPSAAGYANGTLVGALVIALTILIPGMPNMIMYMKMGNPVPQGWSYNPSSWPQRWIMIVTGFAGWIVSRYLAAFQLGYIEEAWDPFFGISSTQVLNSNMSHMWPISDAGLGAFSYTLEFLMGWMGAPTRWRTMPWMVAFFGILVIPLGLTHILLVVSQPIIVGQWCTLCLLAAAIMLPMIPLEVDEVIAMFQHLVRCKRRGESMWRVFWKGGSPEGCEKDERTPPMMEMNPHPGKVFVSSIWGMSFPWTLVAATVLGVVLTFVPGILGDGKPASHIQHLCGLLTIVVSVISMGEVVRLGRYLNVPLGLGAAIVPWFLSGATTGGCIAATFLGIGIAALSIPRGKKTETYGLWDKWVR